MGFWVLVFSVGGEKGMGRMECYDQFMGHECEQYSNDDDKKRQIHSR